MNKDIDQSIFEDMPVPKALAAMALPTILSQLITTVYNLADAFFIGKTNDPYKVAALSLAFVLHLFLTAIANLFGIGRREPDIQIAWKVRERKCQAYLCV